MKAQIIPYLANLAQSVLEGEIDPIDAYIDIYDIKKTAEDMAKVIRDDVLSRAENLDKDHIQKGYNVQVKSKTTYSYNHSERYRLLKEQLKTIESQMKFAVKHGEMADTNTGELIEPAETKTSTFITLTYKGDEH